MTCSSLLVTVHVHLDRVSDPGAARRSFGADVSQPGEQEKEVGQHKVARASVSFHFTLLLPFSYIFLLTVPRLTCRPFVYSISHPVIKSSNAAALTNKAVIFIQR